MAICRNIGFCMFELNEIPPYSLPIVSFFLGLLLSSIGFFWLKKSRWDRFYVSKAAVSQEITTYQNQILQLQQAEKPKHKPMRLGIPNEERSKNTLMDSQRPDRDWSEYMKTLPSQLETFKMEPDMPPETIPPPPFLPLSTLSISPELCQLNGDNLTLIQGITAELALQLNRIGITSFRQIAEWSSLDVRRVSAVLKLENRIFHENWIVQAQSLFFERTYNGFKFGK